MENLNTIEQIGKQSDKILFQYNLLEKRFDYLSEAFKEVWDQVGERYAADASSLLETVVQEDRPAVHRCWLKLMKGDHVEETVCVVQADSQRFVRYNAYPLKNTEGEIVAIAGIAEDVTKHRQFLDYLAEFGQRKNSALEMVSHDLRGPLAVVKGITSLLRRDLAENRQEEMVKYTQIIERACTTCTDLINDLLSEEHLQSPHIYVNKTRVDINEQIRNVAEFYQKSQIIKQSIILNLPPAPFVVALDQIKFSQILNNLLSNSIKFTPPTGTITISVYTDGDEVVVEHQDNGIGIPAQIQAGLFTKHRNQGRAGLNGEKSSGLGLTIVRDLVELQGGSISIRSQENEGATFTIRLPLHDA